MRSLRKAIIPVLAALLCLPMAGRAQEPAEPAVALPKAPLPYSKVRPNRAPSKARPAPKAASTTPAPPPAGATTPALAGAPMVAAAAPPSPPVAAPPLAAAAPPMVVAGAPPVAAGLPRPAGARLAPGQPLSPAELEAFTDGWMADAMAREHVAGAVVTVVQNGQVVLKKGYGFADLNPRKPADPDRSLFRLGSISKTFTWILLMKDVEAGRIRLDRPVNLYLPDRVKVRDEGQQRDVLVANLMDHTPGFEDRALGQLFERDPNRVRPLDLYLRQERPKRVRAPGLHSSYSNYGSGLAGQAVAWVNAKPFERLVEERITMPLGMTRTTFREARPERRGLPAAMPQALQADAAQGYAWRDAGFRPMAYEYVGQLAPAGAASSTAGDMARYMLMLLGDGSWNGVTVFGPRTAQALRTPLQRRPRGINGWAHGFIVSELAGGHRAYGHLGHTLAFQSNMTLAPSLGLGVFVSTNSETGAALADVFPDRLVRHFYAPPAVFPRPGSPQLAERAATFKGDFLSSRRTYSGLERFAGLAMGAVQVSVTDDGRLLTNGGGPTQAWVPEGPVEEGRFISTLSDERLVFRMEDGRAVNFVRPENSALYQRAGFTERGTVIGLLAGLTAAAAFITLVGLAMRNRRELRQNPTQARASLVQNIQAGLWLAAILLFAGWMAGSDMETIVYGWPGPSVIVASTCALMATLLNVATIAAVPAVWRGGRRVDSWNVVRKVAYSLTVLIYTAFSVVLLSAGALQPWSG